MCPDCGKKYSIFGESHIDEIAKEYGTDVLAKLPIDPDMAKCADTGTVELYPGNLLEEAADIIENKLNK